MVMTERVDGSESESRVLVLSQVDASATWVPGHMTGNFTIALYLTGRGDILIYI